MVSHGLVAGGLFLMVGMIYERCHTRELAAYGGLAKLLPVYSVFFAILTLASIGLPTTSGFTGRVPGAARRVRRRVAAVRARRRRIRWCSSVERRRRRRARRALHAVVRAALPVRRGEGAASAACSISTSARRRFWRRSSSPCSRSACFPHEPMRKTELAARAIPAAGRRADAGRRRSRSAAAPPQTRLPQRTPTEPRSAR